MDLIKNNNSVELEIQSMFSEIFDYQLKLLSYSDSNDSLNFKFVKFEKFNLNELDLFYNKLIELYTNIVDFEISIGKLKDKSLLLDVKPVNTNILIKMGKLKSVIRFCKSQNSFLNEIKNNLEPLNFNLIYENNSFPNNLEFDTINFLKKFTNYSFKDKIYVFTIFKYYLSNFPFKKLKHKSWRYVYQINDLVGFKSDQKTFYSKDKDEFLKQILTTIYKLSETNYNIKNDNNSIISILVYSKPDFNKKNSPPNLEFKNVA